jgi:UDP-N-acetylglucosamine--N-acetylmuramyl-(pentapeptide) pyrophosphoryl-undecaprenol N-acetylglucosamine transferase
VPRTHTVLFAGGGTGGHVYPNVAIVERMLDANAAAKVELAPHFLVSDRPGDAQTMTKLGWAFTASPVRPLPTPRKPWLAVPFLLAWRRAVRQCRELIRVRSIAAVVASGGFVSGPALVAARELGIPRAMINLDAIPGKANRRLHAACTAVFTAYSTSLLAGARHVGFPLRRASLGSGDRSEARVRLGLDPDRPVLFVTGATHGAESLIKSMIALADDATRVAELREWQVLHQVGTFDPAIPRAAYERAGLRAVVVAYLDRMGDAWHAADLAVSRAGAGSVAEAWANATPTVFLPNPYHADGHQRANADPLVAAGGAMLVTDHIDAERTLAALGPVLARLVANPTERTAMHDALVRTRPPDGAQALADWLRDVVGR